VIPWHEKTWCIPPAADAEFVARMEDLLELYQVPYDARRPVVCMDELCKQLIAETRVPLPVCEGHPARYDYEYERKGVCSLFVFVEPRHGWRKVFVRDRRTKVDWAVCVRVILNEVYPEALCVRLVQDNLNTHTLASLYEAFLPEEARRLARRLEIHYTPKHGSWLNMAETELGILNRQCLDRRLDDPAIIREEVGTWEAERNEVKATINWRFTVADARVKLKNVCPPIEI
jgi:DDE superfamily endonuclease